MIFVGDDWAEDHHDIHVMDADGARLASRRLPEGLPGIRGFHELVATHAEDPSQVVIGIETDRGLWVQALGAAGYQVYVCGEPACGGPLPRSGLRREIRCRRRQAAGRSGPHRPAQPPPNGWRQRAGRGDQGPGPRIRIWCLRHTNALRSALREYYPAALQAFDNLADRDALAVLGRAPTPAEAARLSLTKIRSALKHAG